jgi:hypothetical protein
MRRSISDAALIAPHSDRQNVLANMDVMTIASTSGRRHPHASWAIDAVRAEILDLKRAKTEIQFKIAEGLMMKSGEDFSLGRIGSCLPESRIEL